MTNFLNSKNVSKEQQNFLMSKFYTSLDQVSNYYYNNINNMDDDKFDFILKKLTNISNEWNYSTKYGDINSFLKNLR